MIMNKYVKALCIILVSVLFLQLTACGTTNQSGVSSPPASAADSDIINTGSLLPVVNEPVTMSMLVRTNIDSSDPDDIWFWQYYERVTGVKWDFVTIDESALNERKPIMMATDSYPDVIFVQSMFSNSEIQNNGKDGIFIALNEYIDKYGNEINNRFAEFSYARPMMTCPDGNIYALYKIGPTYLGCIQGHINHVWLEKAGKSIPKTLGELRDVFQAFKDLGDINGDGIANEQPWSAPWTESSNGRGVIMNAYGQITNGSIGSGISVKNDAANYFPMQDDFLKYLTFLNDLYINGLVDPDIFTLTGTEFAAKGQLGTIGYMTSTQPRYATVEGMWEDYTHIIPMVENDDGTKPVFFKNSEVSTPTFYVTDKCKYPEVAVRWINLFYTAEHAMRAGYGPDRANAYDMLGWEDSVIGYEVFENENGLSDEFVWTIPELATDIFRSIGYTKKAEDMSSVQWRNLYILPWASAGIFMMGDEWFYGQLGISVHAYSNDLGGSVESLWRKTFVENAKPYATYGFPSIYFFEDADNDFITEMRTPLTDYVNSMEAKFVTGAESLNKFDEYVAQCKALGADRYEKILYDYYEGYKTRQ